MRTALAASAAAAALLLGACSPAPAPSPDTNAGASVSSVAPGSAESALVAALGFAGMDATSIVTAIDTSPEARPLPYTATVLSDRLILSDGTTEVQMPLPTDEFYLSVAPFLTTTHDCVNHSLSGCRGELANREVVVKVTDSTGAVVLEKETATAANGFVGLWLPRNITGTIEISSDGATGSTPFSTADGSPTCLTTLRLAA